jgi:hypothetical protein
MKKNECLAVGGIRQGGTYLSSACSVELPFLDSINLFIF